MTEKRGAESWGEEGRADYDRAEMARGFAKMVDGNGGEYGESLKVDSAGRIISTSRNRDKAPAYLPAFLETRHGDDPSVEDIYRALRDLGDALPGYEISINEDRTAGILEYRIKQKGNGMQASG